MNVVKKYASFFPLEGYIRVQSYTNDIGRETALDKMYTCHAHHRKTTQPQTQSYYNINQDFYFSYWTEFSFTYFLL